MACDIRSATSSIEDRFGGFDRFFLETVSTVEIKLRGSVEVQITCMRVDIYI